jgi:hypothetical protein
MRNPLTQDCSPRIGTLNTATSPQASPLPLSGDRFESILPPEALDELLRRTIRPGPRVTETPKGRQVPRQVYPWLILGTSAKLLAAIIASMALGWAPPARHSVGPSLERTFHPMTQTPAPVSASTPAVVSTPSPSDVPPVVQSPQIYTEWVRRGSQAGFILCYGNCIPTRSNFFQPDPAPHALPAVQRAELVSMPVRRAMLVRNTPKTEP